MKSPACLATPIASRSAPPQPPRSQMRTGSVSSMAAALMSCPSHTELATVCGAPTGYLLCKGCRWDRPAPICGHGRWDQGVCSAQWRAVWLCGCGHAAVHVVMAVCHALAIDKSKSKEIEIEIERNRKPASTRYYISSHQ